MAIVETSADGGFTRRHGEGEQVLAMGALVTVIVPASATGGRFAVIEHAVSGLGIQHRHTHGLEA